MMESALEKGDRAAAGEFVNLVLLFGDPVLLLDSDLFSGLYSCSHEYVNSLVILIYRYGPLPVGIAA